jgi:hypothetical protein
MEEQWKEIEGYEGLYEISNYGSVKNSRGKIRVNCFNGVYYHITLSKKCKFKTLLIHRLVALHFIPNPENKLEVNHIDGDKFNNHYINLEWNTRSENTIHSIKTGLQIPKKGIERYNCRLTDIQINEIRKKYSSGAYYQKDIAGEYNISRCYVSEIVNYKARS